MSNPAQDEADRLFGYKNHPTSHPEDQEGVGDDDDDDSDKSLESETEKSKTLRTGRGVRDHEDSDSNDEDNVGDMATMTNSKMSYTLPATTSYANTGPKGVIADAQHYHRSKRKAFRTTLQNISNNISLGSRPTAAKKSSHPDGSSSSPSDLDDEDNDEFMQQWRAQRLAELQAQQDGTGAAQRKVSPSRRLYGRLDAVDADGYLDAIEKSPADTTVVVGLLYDTQSGRDVEDELERLARQFSQVRFVKLPAEIAEMEWLEIPAVLAYRNGDVFATVSGARHDGLETLLIQHGVLPPK